MAAHYRDHAADHEYARKGGRACSISEELKVVLRASWGSRTKDKGGVHHQRLTLGFIVSGHKVTSVVEEEGDGVDCTRRPSLHIAVPEDHI